VLSIADPGVALHVLWLVPAAAHRDPCHRRHDCPSDRGAYVCGDTGRLTPAQRTWLEGLTGCAGVEAYVWRPSDWEAIVERLKSEIS